MQRLGKVVQNGRNTHEGETPYIKVDKGEHIVCSAEETRRSVDKEPHDNKRDKAGTGLRQSINRLITPTKGGTAALKEIGLQTKDFVDQKGHMKSMTDIFKLLNTHMKNLNGHDRTDVFHAIFGQTGQQAGGILVQNADALGKLDDKVKKSVNNDYVHKLAKKNMNTAKQQIKRFKAAGEAVEEVFARKMLPILTEFTKKLSGTLDYIGKMPKGFQEVIVGVGLLTPALVVLGGAVGTVAKSIGFIKSAKAWIMRLITPGKFTKVATSISEESAAYQAENDVLGEQIALLKERNDLQNGGTGELTGTGAEPTLTGAKGGKGSRGGAEVPPAVGSRLGNEAKNARKLEAARQQGGIRGNLKVGALKTKGSLTSMMEGSLGKLLNGAMMISAATQLGSDAYDAFNKKNKSEAQQKGAWGAAGGVVGGAIGGVIGGPSGALLGANIGEAAGKKFSDTAVAKATVEVIDKNNKKNKTNSKNVAKAYTGSKAEKHSKTTGSGFFANTMAMDSMYPNAAAGAALNKGTSDKGKGKSKKKSKPKKSAGQKAFDSLPKDAREATKKATGYIKQTNRLWAESEGQWNAKGKKAHAESNKLQSESDAKYDKAYGTLQKYTTKQNGAIDKSAAHLVKIGAITQDEANKALQTEKGDNNKRLQNVQNTMKLLKTAEHNGGEDRTALQKKLNEDIIKLTDRGGKKQRALMSKLNTDTTKLSEKQFKSVVKSANDAAKETKKTAKDTYTDQKKAAKKSYATAMQKANDDYNLTKKSAKKISGSNKKLYKQIMKKAEDTRVSATGSAYDQYQETVGSAKSQYQETVDWAEAQRKGVVDKAAQQAGDVIDGMNGFGSAIATVINQNIAAGISGAKQPKFKSGDFTKNLAKQSQAGQKLKGGSKKSKDLNLFINNGVATPKAKHKKKDLKLGSQIGSFAVGDSVHKRQTAMVGENGIEVLQRGKTFQLIGQNGAQLMGLLPGDVIYNNADTRKMMSGSYNKRLKGFASGTASLGSFAGETTGDSSSSDETSKKVSKNYKSMERSTKSSLSKIEKKNKATWDSAENTTKKSTANIHKAATKNSDSTKKDYLKNIKSMKTQSGKYLDKMLTDSKSHGTKISKDADKQSGNTKDKVVSNWKSLNKQFKSSSDDMVDGFHKSFKKLGPHAKDAMQSAVKSMNQGISAIDTTLSQFGGNKSVLKPIHYATGSRGPIASDRLAILNDAVVGPQQELVVRDDKLLKPTGKDVLTPLRRGDEVLNGTQTKKLLSMLPHYAKGTGLSNEDLIKLAAKNAGDIKNTWKSSLGKSSSEGEDTDLAKGVGNTTKAATDSVGPAWTGAMWNFINKTIQGSGNGTLTPHFGGKFSLSSPYGERSGEVSGFHKGMDFSAPMGTPIPAQYSGTVVQAGHAAGFGNWVVIKPDDSNLNTIYGHMRSYSVHAGQHVDQGQIIARVGSEGQSTGPHVHYEVRQGLGGKSFDPESFKEKLKPKKTQSTKLTNLVKEELGSSAIAWIKKHLTPLVDGGIGNFSLSGSVASRARELASAIKKAYPQATDAGIAGVLGNWIQESNLNPSAINSSDHGTGLGQWTNSRETGLRNWLKSHHYAWNSAAGQIAYALHEPGAAASFKSALRINNPTQAARTFFAGWESGGAMDSTGSARINNANAAYRYIKGYANGGLITKHQIAQVGEGNKPEMVLPLTKSARSYELIGKSLSILNGQDGVASRLGHSESYKILESVLDKLNLETTPHVDSDKSSTNVDITDLKNDVAALVQMMQQVVVSLNNPTPAFISGGDQAVYDSYNRQQKIRDMRDMTKKGLLN